MLLLIGMPVSAQAGDAEDCGDNGAALLRTEPARVVAACRNLADQGNAIAQSNLGIMYATGQGVPQSYPDAVSLFRNAADQGYAAAQYNLGRMYESGQGLPQSYADAAAWYRRAASQGYANAENNLGVLY